MERDGADETNIMLFPLDETQAKKEQAGAKRTKWKKSNDIRRNGHRTVVAKMRAKWADANKEKQ